MLRIVIGALLVALTFAGGYAVATHKTVTLSVDGTETTVSTMKSHVIDVVQENGFEVGDRDDLFPAGDAEVRQSETIVLRRSRPLDISLDDSGRKVEYAYPLWTAKTTFHRVIGGFMGVVLVALALRLVFRGDAWLDRPCWKG